VVGEDLPDDVSPLDSSSSDATDGYYSVQSDTDDVAIDV